MRDLRLVSLLPVDCLSSNSHGRNLNLGEGRVAREASIGASMISSLKSIFLFLEDISF